MKYFKLLELAEKEITKLFQKAGTSLLVYHNLSHTRSVVTHASEMAKFYAMSDQDFFIVVTAAWFHDAGYLDGPLEEHEVRSARLARVFLERNQVDEGIISRVSQCILSTRLPQSPKNLAEEIVCDADLFHLGLPGFVELNKKMKKERELFTNDRIPKSEWRKATLRLMESHHYHTGYAKNRLDHVKQENMQRLKEKNRKAIVQAHSTTDTTFVAADPRSAAPGSADMEKAKKPGRGIETMFRISSTNHQRLSDMADNKANIMITTTSIILSILLSVLLRKLEDNPHLVIPSFLLLLVCIVTMIFSIKATRPQLPNGRFTKEDLDEKKTNLLFFGNYYKMDYQQYHDGMEALMNDSSLLYGTLTLDLYSQGIVLGKKYRLLRLAYNIFMYGMTCAVIAFFIAVLLAINNQ